MHHHWRKCLSPKAARAIDKNLKLVLPVKVRHEFEVGRLLDQSHSGR
jgi:hypothetical protein